MLKKIHFTLILVLLTFLSASVFSQSNKSYKYKPIEGSETGKAYINSQQPNSSLNEENKKHHKTEGGLTVNFSAFGLTSYYDHQSNGSSNQIWQDPDNAEFVHSSVTYLPVFGGTRVCNYVLSTDRGATWTNFGSIDVSQSGFPSIYGLSDGSAIVTMQTTAGEVAQTRSQVFTDLGPGFGSWSRFDPGLSGANSLIWGRIIATQEISRPVKWVLAASQNLSGGEASTITQSNLYPPGIFSQWQNYPANNSEQYCLARGEDGRIGNAYIAHGAADLGDVMLRESFDDGLTWTVPVKIFDANLARDTLSAFGGISMVYLANIPCVTFEVAVYDGVNLYPRSPSYIYFWKRDLNNGLARKLAGPDNVPFYPNTGPEESYGGYTPLCRPVIGKYRQYYPLLFIAMNAATSHKASDSNVYYATYFMASVDNGNFWSTPERITPQTPLKDYRYVSMSPTNAFITSAYIVQMTVQSHDYAGTFAPNQPPGPSAFNSMRLNFIWWKSDSDSLKDQESISLNQNFPNPFNPVTDLEFNISNKEFISLKVYDISGKEAAIIVNKELTPGNYKFSFDASGLTSGMYFYTLRSKGSSITKKMLLLK
jgi:hypothetical protein